MNIGSVRRSVAASVGLEKLLDLFVPAAVEAEEEKETPQVAAYGVSRNGIRKEL